ncbi:5-methyltetrahydropteroyltriglutamate--homocysteine methyltransferase [Platanthera zijinensis]|uniref:5-methyltetrahydropteroyltriglutamate--homocysteine methyltransferase n=1 Tax=Platanthera zijinensis TaxID=2320716 RepID=A0AAP0BL37_9ASPA
MASHIVGYPRVGPKRELKFALESFWDGKSSAEDLQKVSADLRTSIWKQMAAVGIKYIPSNTFSYYDQVLDTTALLGAVPERYSWNGGEIGFDTYFSMARGNASVPAMEMTKWFDTNYHFIVPELGPNTKFSYASHKAVSEYKEAKSLGIDTVPVLVGPVTYLLLSKPAKGVDKSFHLLSLLEHILPIYKEVIAELKAAGASWVQFDEPTLVRDLDSHQLEAFTKAYTELESSLSGLNVVIETYFADVSVEAYKTITALTAITGLDSILCVEPRHSMLSKVSDSHLESISLPESWMEGTSGQTILLRPSALSKISRVLSAKISLWFQLLAPSCTPRLTS